MPDLLQSKLHVPAPRRTVLTRSRLLDRLDASSGVGLTLVSAPAGFGKTTLLSEWSSRSPLLRRATAWVSLDERDNDPASFWTYVVAALQRVVPGLGAGAQALLLSPAQTTQGLELLLNDLQALEQDVHLVLDDLHVVVEQQVHEGLRFLLDHLPPQVHLVLTTRADPPLQLARLRARGQLVELRAADLRFTADEAAAYLGESMGLALTEPQVLALEGRTEGWIAALQLAALSMQGRQDVSGFLRDFTGDDRYIVDYLAEEVLEGLPTDLRTFLLRTCLLRRLSGPLCDAVTQQSGGRATLAALDRQNLFLVPLDDARRWYRYHHLFADVLRARLLDEQPELVAELHLRASTWHEDHGERAEAVHHALAGGHAEQAAHLVELAIPALRRDRQEATLRRWLEALPEHLLRTRPVLGISHVGALMSSGQLQGVEERLRDVERWLAEGGAAAAAVAEDPLLRTLPGTVAMYRSGQARLRGDVAGTLQHAQRAFDLAGEDDHLERGAAAALLGLAHWTTGDVPAAAERYALSVACMHRAGHLADALGCTLALADLEVERGRLGEALAVLRSGLGAAQRAPTAPRGTADMHTGLAALLLERDELDAAAEHLRTAAVLGEQAALPQHAYRWRVAMAQVHQRRGDPATALELLDEAEALYDTDYSPDVRPVPALRARLWLLHGRTEDAAEWARSRRLSVDDEPSYLREFEHLTVARTVLRQSGPLRQLDRFLSRLLDAAEQAGRTGTVLDVLVLQALSAQAQRDTHAALPPLLRAVAMAEPHGYVRLFADHGAPLAALLRAIPQQDGSPYVRQLLAAVSGGPRAARRGGPDRLSERETDVLRLLASDLDGPGIARSLVVSVHTVRTHTKSIYAKLGVTSRRAAVRRAQDLGLLHGTAVASPDAAPPSS